MPPLEYSFILCLLCIVGTLSQWQNGQNNNKWSSEWNSITNCPLQTHENPQSYWHVDQYQRRYLRRCPPGQAFFAHKCACDHTPPPCDLRASERGLRYYEQFSNGYWIPMECAIGTAFDPNTCLCSTLI